MAYMATPQQMFGRSSLFSPQGYGSGPQGFGGFQVPQGGFQQPMMPPGGPMNAQLIQQYLANRAPMMSAYQAGTLNRPGAVPGPDVAPTPVSSTAAIPRPPQEAPQQRPEPQQMRQWMRPAGTGGQQSVFSWAREAPGPNWRRV